MNNRGGYLFVIQARARQLFALEIELAEKAQRTW